MSSFDVEQPDFPSLDTPAIAELARLDQWVGWRIAMRQDTPASEAKPTKVPIDVNRSTETRIENASVIDPKTWCSFARAYEFWHRSDRCAGVGFVVTWGCPYTVIDLDHCRDPKSGEVEDWAAAIVRRLQSYTEVSPSRTGLHIFIRGKPEVGRRRIDRLEVYPQKRFLTVTGWRLCGIPNHIAEGGAAISHILNEALDAKHAKNKAKQVRREIDAANKPIGKHDPLPKPAPNLQSGDPELDAMRAQLEPFAVAEAEPPLVKLEAIFANSPTVKATWDKTRKDITGKWTQSEYDLALANFFLDAEWTPVEIMQALISVRRKHGAGLKLDRSPACDYYARTIVAAGRNRIRNKAQEALSPEALEHLDPDARREAVLEALTTLFSVKVLRVVRYLGDPHQYAIETVKGRMFGSIDLLFDQAVLRKTVASVCGVVLPRCKNREQDERAQAMLDIAVDEELSVEATDSGQARAWVAEYLDTHPKPSLEFDPAAIAQGNPYRRNDATWIVGPDLVEWLKTQKRIFLTPQKLGLMMRAAGYQPGSETYKREDGSATSRSVWRIG